MTTLQQYISKLPQDQQHKIRLEFLSIVLNDPSLSKMLDKDKFEAYNSEYEELKRLGASL